MKNEKGCIRCVITIIIFVLFLLTVYICLDVFEVIEVPDEYSAVKWIENHIDFRIDINDDEVTFSTNAIDVDNTTDKIENFIEKKKS